jgi:hypothetical protein
MRFRAVVSCFAIIAFLPQLALAARPAGEIGALQAVFDFCVRVDPSEGRDFDKQADSLFKGFTPAQVAALRKSTEYRRGYQLLVGSLSSFKGQDGVLACQAISDVPHEGRRHEENPGRKPGDR